MLGSLIQSKAEGESSSFLGSLNPSSIPAVSSPREMGLQLPGVPGPSPTWQWGKNKMFTKNIMGMGEQTLQGGAAELTQVRVSYQDMSIGLKAILNCDRQKTL